MLFKKRIFLCLLALVVTFIIVVNISQHSSVSIKRSQLFKLMEIRYSNEIELLNRSDLPINMENKTNDLYLSICDSYVNKLGYGNRIYALLSAFTIAILYDRKFIVCWPENHHKEPFSNTFLHFESYKEKVKNSVHLTPKNNSCRKMFKDIRKIINTDFNSYEGKNSVYYADDIAYFFEVCSNPKHYDKLLNLNLTNLETVKRAKEMLRNLTTSFDNDALLEAVYNIGYEVGGRLLNNYWIPETRILMKVNEIIEGLFTGNYVIGLQIRTHFLTNAYAPYVNTRYHYFDYLDEFIRCAIKIEKHYKENEINPKPVKWYISSDSNEVIKMIKSLYPNKVLSSGLKPLHISHDEKGYASVIIDIEVLSKTETILMTGGSTFGMVACLKSERLNNFVISRDRKCRRLTLSDPGHTPLYDYSF